MMWDTLSDMPSSTGGAQQNTYQTFSGKAAQLRHDYIMREQTAPHWLARMLGTSIIAAAAYCTAAIANAILNAVSERAIGSIPAPLQSAELQAPLFVILLLITLVALATPLFQSSRDATVRRFSLLSTGFLIAYVVLSAGGPFDPAVPLDVFIRYVVTPLRQATGMA